MNICGWRARRLYISCAMHLSMDANDEKST